MEKFQAVDVVPSEPCGIPSEIGCSRIWFGCKFDRVVVADGFVVKNALSHSAGWNEVDMATLNAPAVVADTVTVAEGGGGGVVVPLDDEPLPQPVMRISGPPITARMNDFIARNFNSKNGQTCHFRWKSNARG